MVGVYWRAVVCLCRTTYIVGHREKDIERPVNYPYTLTHARKMAADS